MHIYLFLQSPCSVMRMLVVTSMAGGDDEHCRTEHLGHLNILLVLLLLRLLIIILIVITIIIFVGMSPDPGVLELQLHTLRKVFFTEFRPTAVSFAHLEPVGDNCGSTCKTSRALKSKL